MSFKLIKIRGNVYHMLFKDQKLMTKSLLRFQEHFESPHFRGKIFTLKEFKTWYKKSRDSQTFTYYEDWSGFNFPSKIFKPFRNGEFKQLSSLEKAVLKATAHIKGPFYVIATAGSTVHALRHELGHALYSTDKSYRKSVDDILINLPLSFYPKEKIKNMGYHSSVLHDELHAYLIDGWKYFDKHFSMSTVFNRNVTSKYEKASKKLSKLLDGTLSGR